MIYYLVKIILVLSLNMSGLAFRSLNNYMNYSTHYRTMTPERRASCHPEMRRCLSVGAVFLAPPKLI